VLPPIPYLDLAGYERRTSLVPEDVDYVASRYPGYVERRIARGSSWINARLQKRYRVPLGQEAPELLSFGTTPPLVVLTGRPTLGCLDMSLQITTPGPLGTAVFQWSPDGGESWTTGVSTAATVPLGTTGLVATFPAQTYAVDNLYTSSTPVPEVALGWLVALVDVDVWKRRGTNPQDPAIALATTDRDAAVAEITEAANSDTGLFELPTIDTQGDSAVNHGGPLFYSEASPFVSADLQEEQGRAEDFAGTGTYGGN